MTLPLALALALASPTFPCKVVSVHDGDTFTCAGRIKARLRGVDAADFEDSSPCRTHKPGYVCDDRLAAEARDRLAKLILNRTLVCQPDGRSYSRITAWCTLRGKDLSCEAVRLGIATRWDAYWPKGRICG